MRTLKQAIMKETLEQLEQDAIQVKHQMKKALYRDDFYNADRYASELGEIDFKIKKLKEKEQ